MMPVTLTGHDALLVVDLQNDFLPGGALEVSGGDTVIAPIMGLVRQFDAQGLLIFASRDWHPPDHCSFREQGGPWPVHCVAGSWGAEFSPVLRLPANTELVFKATRPEAEAYSCFDGTGLEERLRRAGVHRVFIAGLATEYCVLSSVRDARAAGLEVIVIEDAIWAISRDAGEVARAKDAMRALGATLIPSRRIQGERPESPATRRAAS